MNTDEKGKALLSALREYIEKCRNENDSKDKREKKTIPNVCGYCRHMAIGRDELLRRLSGKEELADRISTVLEDSVINSDPSAGTLAHCIKLAEALRGDKTDGTLTVIFPHSDGEDAAS